MHLSASWRRSAAIVDDVICTYIPVGTYSVHVRSTPNFKLRTTARFSAIRSDGEYYFSDLRVCVTGSEYSEPVFA